jgi:hypothetical protein
MQGLETLLLRWKPEHIRACDAYFLAGDKNKKQTLASFS